MSSALSTGHNPVPLQTTDAGVRLPSSAAPAAIKIENVSRAAISTVGNSGNVVTSFMPSGIATSAQNVAVSSAKLGTTAGAATDTKVAGLTPETKLLDKRRITDLLKEVDPLEQLDEDVEELLTQIADDFIDNVVTSACQLARHRKSGTVEVKDVQLHLERHWNMWIPGFGSEELRPYKKQATTEAHRQRMALIKKTMKKS